MARRVDSHAFESHRLSGVYLAQGETTKEADGGDDASNEYW